MSDYAVVNPVTGQTLATYPTTTDAELETAIASAAAAYRSWREVPVPERAARIRRAAKLHRERRDELAAIIVREMGKPLAAALGEVDFAADITEYYADNAERITGDQPIDILGEGTAVIRRSPLGVLLGIMPWNFPYYQVARFAAPNLAVGNTILLKHAPQCPESAAAIRAIYRDAGFPEGAYVPLYITNEQAAAVIADPRVQGVSVTGSERAGAAVAAEAGRNLKKVALELGGSDPFILLSTDDLDATVTAAVKARLDNTGQSCNAAKRFIVHEDLYDPFMEKFAAAMGEWKPGDPTGDAAMGPLSSSTAAERLQDQLDRAKKDGAKVVLNGERKDNFFSPTILADIPEGARARYEEFFGPVASVYKVGSEDEAVKVANDTPFGLGSYVFTTDAGQAERVANKIDAGMVYVNIVGADGAELPFGGVKRSGSGRELGRYGADEFVNKKLIRVG